MTKKEMLAFEKVQISYQEQYDEMIDILYHYMLSYKENLPDIMLFRDEFENMTGERDHEFIVDYILSY